MVNIRQLTQADMTGASTVQKTIDKGGDRGQTVTVDYYIITSEILGSSNVFKMGYCANSNPAINYPIFLTLNGTETEFQLGKTGMFEFHDETWEDVNVPTEEQIATVSLSEVKVPAGFNFCLDYCYSV